MTQKMLAALTMIGENPDHSAAIVFGSTGVQDGLLRINWRTLLALKIRGLVTVRREDDMVAEGGWDVGLTEAGSRAVAR